MPWPWIIGGAAIAAATLYKAISENEDEDDDSPAEHRTTRHTVEDTASKRRMLRDRAKAIILEFDLPRDVDTLISDVKYPFPLGVYRLLEESPFWKQLDKRSQSLKSDKKELKRLLDSLQEYETTHLAFGLNLQTWFDSLLDYQALYRWLPGHEMDVKRLEAMDSKPQEPQIVVFGKYNHGKSTLLNALVGYEAFAVADRRETRDVQSKTSDGVIWVDTPGLDADVAGKDDMKALEAALEQADGLLLVHSVRSGELDAKEVEEFRRWIGRGIPAVLVLTQMEQRTAEELEHIHSEVAKQLPGVDVLILPVSAKRECHGKPALRRASGFEPLRRWVEELQQQVEERRTDEADRLRRKLRDALQKQLESVKRERKKVKHEKERLEKRFRKRIGKLRSEATYL